MAAPPTKNLVSRPVTIEAEDGSGNVATQSYSVTAGGVQKTLEYDLNGNLRYEKDPGGTVLREFQWDAINRLVKIIDGNHETAFEYDGFDRRVRIIEEENGIEQSNHTYLWDGTYIAQRSSADGSTIERSYFSQGFEDGSDDYYTTKDHLGSIREVVASDGTTIEAAYDYSPWGEVTKIGGSGAESEFLYTGHFYHDKSDLHLTLYRAYNPKLGIWLSRDPMESYFGIPAEFLSEGPNLYAYGPNSPINGYDDDGLLWWPITGAIGGAIDLGLQIYMNDGDLSCVDWADVGISAATSAAGYGMLSNVGKVRSALKARKTLNRLNNKRVPEKTWSNYAKNQKKEALANKNNIPKVAGAVGASQGLKAGLDYPDTESNEEGCD